MEIKARVVQCPNGHYYNAALHDTCPYCAQENAKQSVVTENTGDWQFKSAGEDIGKTEPLEQEVSYNVQTDVPVRTDAPVPEAVSETMPAGIINNGVERIEPVVGWLVCVDGPMKGYDFRIHAGYNYIGREKGDIRITGDRQISREKHALIAFDEEEMVFFMGPSAGRNIIRVNGRTIMTAVELRNYDVISIGTTKLVFIAFCGEYFDWRND